MLNDASQLQAVALPAGNGVDPIIDMDEHPSHSQMSDDALLRRLQDVRKAINTTTQMLTTHRLSAVSTRPCIDELCVLGDESVALETEVRQRGLQELQIDRGVVRCDGKGVNR